MRQIIAILLLVLAGLLGLMVLMNVYVAVSAANSGELREITKPNIPMQVTFVLLAIVSCVSGVTLLRRTGKILNPSQRVGKP